MIDKEKVAKAKSYYECISILSFNFSQKNSKDSLATDVLKQNLYLFNKQLLEKNKIIKEIQIEYSHTIILQVNEKIFEKIDTSEFMNACEELIKEYLGIPRIEAQSGKIKYFEKLKSLNYFVEKSRLLEDRNETNFEQSLKKFNLLK